MGCGRFGRNKGILSGSTWEQPRGTGRSARTERAEQVRHPASYRVAIKMISRRRGEGDAGIHESYVEEPSTMPANLAFDCNLVSERISQSQECAVQGALAGVFPVVGKLRYEVPLLEGQ